MKPLSSFMAVAGTRDVMPFFKCEGKALTWQSRPTDVLLLTRLAPLYTAYFRTCPSGKIPQALHQQALKNLNQEKVHGVGACKLNFTHDSDSAFLDKLDISIRVVAFMYKQLKQDDTIICLLLVSLASHPFTLHGKLLNLALCAVIHMYCNKEKSKIVNTISHLASVASTWYVLMLQLAGSNTTAQCVATCMWKV